jgi:hypothetical protein
MMNIDIVRAQGDLLRNYLWDLQIPNVPGGGNALLLTLLVRKSSIPEVKSDAIELPYKARTIRYAGRTTSHGTIDADFVIDKSGALYKALYAWKNLAGNVADGKAVDPMLYKTTGILTLHDAQDTVKLTYSLSGLWLEVIKAIDLDQSGNDFVSVSATFSYDGFEMI